MAGLLAARVLYDHFAEVVLVERDLLPDPAPRKGVPQGRHTHAVLPRGGAVFERFFPGITEELVAQGAILADPLADARRFINGAYYCRQPSPHRGLLLTRPLLEHHLRCRLLALETVRLRQGYEALGLIATDGGKRVNGVRIGPARGGTPDEWLEAELVVDATGRGSRAPAWLADLGYEVPVEERVDIGLGYATRFYRRHADQLDGAKIVMIPPTPSLRRGAIALAQEGDRWITTLIGYRGERPPKDHAGCLEFAKSLAAPDMYELIREAEPLCDPIPATFLANQRRRYERLARFPAGLIVMGDAICSFNPAYAQGMSVAAAEAEVLGQCCAAGLKGLAQRFFRQAGKVVDVPWTMTVGNDRWITSQDIDPGARTRFLRWYMSRLHLAAHHDPVAALAFLAVAGLLAPPASLLRPQVALRVIRAALPRPHSRSA